MKAIILTVFLSSVFTLQAQQLMKLVVAAGGATLANDQIVLDHTIGEPVVGTFTADGLRINAGFHQGTEDVTTSISDTPFETNAGDLVAYPNPVKEILVITNDQKRALQFVIRDLQGKTWFRRDFTARAEVNMHQLPPGPYFLVIQDGSEVVDGQKILKIQ